MLSLLVMLSLAHAQSDPDADARARQFYDNGALLYEEGRYEDAILAFQEAYNLSQRPALLFNIANAQERAGQWGKAMDTLGKYRVYAPEDERETLDRRIRNIERRIDELKAAQPMEKPPVSIVPPKPEKQATILRPAPLALGGLGLVGFGVGAGFGVAALAARSDADAMCAPAGASHVCPDAAAVALAADKQNAMFADISFGVGTAGMLTGIALGLWGQGGPLAVSPGMISVHGDF